jgi:cardiolipin synthase
MRPIYDILINPGLPALILIFQIIMLMGCETLPDFRQEALSFNYKGEPLKIVDGKGPLPPGKLKEVMSGLKQEDHPNILGRHLAFVEHITGKPLISGNRATLLRDGPETFAAMEKAINSARDHINVETFIFRDDEVGMRFSELLKRKSREGVVVNLIYDSWGARYTNPDFFANMRGFGINAVELNPVDRPLTVRGWNINNRDHRKILIVDGSIAFTGGINFYRGYSGSSLTGPYKKGQDVSFFWRDMHVQLEGPAVAEFQKLFVEMWEVQGDQPLPPANYFPALENKGDLLVRVLASAPDKDSRDIYAGYISAIVNAQKSIYITNAYFTPDRDFLKALTDAAENGVDVKMILPSFSDFWLPFRAGRSNYAHLLKSGVKIYEMQGDLLHSKTAVIDGVWSTVGSSNLNLRSFLYDAEVNAVIIGRDIGRQMEEIFYRDMEKSREVTLEQWDKRPFLDRFKESVTLLFRYFL